MTCPVMYRPVCTADIQTVQHRHGTIKHFMTFRPENFTMKINFEFWPGPIANTQYRSTPRLIFSSSNSKASNVILVLAKRNIEKRNIIKKKKKKVKLRIKNISLWSRMEIQWSNKRKRQPEGIPGVRVLKNSC